MNRNLSPRRRALSLLLALSLMLGLLPGFPLVEEASAHWADGYLSQMAEWGFIRADQAQNPDQQLTRADFMSIVNRAYGYHEVGATPFEDVKESDWFYDDVGIAYTARYIKGTSPTTASPNDTLDRETAATILGRNMMLQESPGELMDFSDARDISNWARGTIKSSMEHYLVSGYDDGTFRPLQAMTWGEIAALVTRTIGTPLQDAGEYSLGGVFGNVTVTSPGVTLRDTVISGDLYITGGVGLGGIKLENVTVLGRIIASGTGTSEGGASILMRNVIADELLVDNLQDKEVSIQADGITEIGKTTVRSSAYIEDNTPEGLGLHMISFEGDSYGEDEEVPEGWTPPQLTLAGRVEEVINKTPNSTVEAAKGTVAKLTVDEEAEGSHVVIDRGAVIKDLVLDTGINVTGQGDITKLEVNAPGSIVSMLPDEIVIRPGITAVIDGQVMDSTAAEESSMEPMILSGYPQATDITPNSIVALFSTNKKGTIHWAISAITDGSVGEDELLKPPSYGSIAMQHGTLTSPRGNEEVSTTIANLESDGSYYLSAVLEDDRGQTSPVKVISFTTPDNSVPAFNTGYPRMTMTSRTNSQVVVSANKSCVLYYALYPVGATAPTANDLRTASVSGSLGYGVRTLEKNVEDVFTVNDRTLEEQETYVVYFWLTDFNGANSSQVVSLTFTTADETPPYFLQNYPQVTNFTETSIAVTFRLSENGTVYWALVNEGDRYPLPEPGQTGTAPLDSDYAKLQVQSGMNALKSGSVAAREGVDGVINLTGLEGEKSYDLYLVSVDAAGNYSVVVTKLTVHTLDENPPVISLRFGNASTSADGTVRPKTTSDIYLDFSENVCRAGTTTDFMTLYNATLTGSDTEKEQAMLTFVTTLQETIKFLQRVTGTGTSGFQEVKARSYPYLLDADGNDLEEWVIDYSQAELELSGGKLTIKFPNSALNLESGGRYRFDISGLTDNSYAYNALRPDVVTDNDESRAEGHNVYAFTVDFATVFLENTPPSNMPLDRRDTDGTLIGEPLYIDTDGSLTQNKTDAPKFITMDAYFRMTPDSTSKVSSSSAYDILLWANLMVQYDLYYRVLKDGVPVTADGDHSKNLLPQVGGDKHTTVDEYGWIYLGESPSKPTQDGEWVGLSIMREINSCGQSDFPLLINMEEGLTYEFAISLTSVKSRTERENWSLDMAFRVYVGAGYTGDLYTMGTNITRYWSEYLEAGRVDSIGESEKNPNYLEIPIGIEDSAIPQFDNRTPSLVPTETTVNMGLYLDHYPGYIYYAIAEADTDGNGTPLVGTTVRDTATDSEDNVVTTIRPITIDDVPKVYNGAQPDLVTPTAEAVYTKNLPEITDERRMGVVEFRGETTAFQLVEGLEPETTYYVYFVLKGESTGLSKVYVFQFTTTAAEKPRIQSNVESNGDVTLRLHVASWGHWRVVSQAAALNTIQLLRSPFSSYAYTATDIEELTGEPNDGIPTIYADQNFTVLQALTTPYRSTDDNLDNYIFEERQVGYTVFDYYASENARAQVYNLIQNMDGISGDDLINVGRSDGDLTVPAPTGSGVQNWSQYTAQTNLSENNQNRYYLITYAINDGAVYDTGYESTVASFQAVLFGRADLEEPEVESVDLEIWPEEGGTYGGNIYVDFKRDVFLHGPSTQGAIEMTTANLLTSPNNHVFSKPTGSTVTPESTGSDSFHLSYASVALNRSLRFGGDYFANRDNLSSPKTLVVTWVEENGYIYAVATWGGVEVGRSNALSTSTQPSTRELIFTGLPLSGGMYVITQEGTAGGTYKGVLNGTGKIVGVNVSTPSGTEANPTASDVVTATVTNNNNDITLTIVGKGVGSERVTVTALVDTGTGFVSVSRIFDVTITDGIVVKINGDVVNGGTYTWDRSGAGNNNPSATVTISTESNMPIISTPTVASADTSVVNVTSNQVNMGEGNKTATANIQYMGTPGMSTSLTIQVGAMSQAITITLTGAPDAGGAFDGLDNNPYSSR